MVCQVIVCGVMGKDVTVDLCYTEAEMKSITVRELKRKIAQRLPGNIGEEDMRLFFTDKPLEDFKKLSDYGIQHMSVIQMVMRLRG